MKKILLKIFGLFFIAMAAPSLYGMSEDEFEKMVQEKQEEQKQIKNFKFDDEIENAGRVGAFGGLINPDISELVKNLNLLIKYNKSDQLIKALNKIQETLFPVKAIANQRWYLRGNATTRLKDLKPFWTNLKNNLDEFDTETLEAFKTPLEAIGLQDLPEAIQNNLVKRAIEKQKQENAAQEKEPKKKEAEQKEQEQKQEDAAKKADEEKKEQKEAEKKKAEEKPQERKESEQEQTFNFDDAINNAGKMGLVGKLENEDISELVKNLNLLITNKESKKLIDALNKLQETLFPDRNSNYRWYTNNNHIQRFNDLQLFWSNLKNNLNEFDLETVQKFKQPIEIIKNNMPSSESETHAESSDLFDAVEANLIKKIQSKQQEDAAQQEEERKRQEQERQEQEDAAQKKAKKEQEEERKHQEQERQEQEDAAQKKAKKEQEDAAQQEEERKRQEQERQEQEDAAQKKAKKEQEDAAQQEEERKRQEQERQEQEGAAQKKAEEEKKEEPISPEELQKNLSIFEIQLTALYSSLPKKEKLEHMTKSRSKGSPDRKPPTRTKRTQQKEEKETPE